MRKRIWIYIIIAGLLPIGAGGAHLWKALSSQKEKQTELGRLHQSIVTQQLRHVNNGHARQIYGDADHLYIDTQLEPLPLLQKEVAALTHLIEKEPSLPNRELLNRLDFLKSRNHLSFSEGNVEKGQKMEEVLESLSHTVEIDENDLKILLEKIEGAGKKRPQLLITDLSLTRKEGYGQNEVWLMDLKCLKREFQ